MRVMFTAQDPQTIREAFAVAKPGMRRSGPVARAPAMVRHSGRAPRSGLRGGIAQERGITVPEEAKASVRSLSA